MSSENFNRMILFIHIYILLSLIEVVYSACPHGWKPFAGSCYLIHTQSRLSWHDAQNYCLRRSGHLVHLDFHEENHFVIEKVQSHINEVKDSGRRAGIWIGGTDHKDEGKWVWSGNNYPILEYTNWHAGEPDSGDGHHDEDCLCMIGNHGYEWEDYRCTDEMYYVCEKIDRGYTIDLVG